MFLASVVRAALRPSSSGRSYSQSVFAQNVFNGAYRLSDAHLTHGITVNGTACLGRYGAVRIDGPFQVNGNLTVRDSILSEVHVNGNSDIYKTTITGISKFFGKLLLSESQFNNTVEFTGKELRLFSTIMNDLKVCKISWPLVNQQLILEGNSSVRGNIEFETGKGVIILRDQSQISHYPHNIQVIDERPQATSGLKLN